MRVPNTSLGLFLTTTLLTAKSIPTILGAAAAAASSSSHETYYQFEQPDGTLTPPIITQKGRHSYFSSSWDEDVNGYTIINDKKGYKVYAKRNEDTGLLESSGLRVGDGNPERQGLQKHISATNYRDNKYNNMMMSLSSSDTYERMDVANGFFKSVNYDVDDTDDRRLPITSGVLKSLVILVRFADHVDRTLPSKEDIAKLYNSDGPNDVVPHGSVRDFYKVSSVDKLTVEATVTPWITLSQPERYYSGGDSGKYTYEVFDIIYEALRKTAENNYITFSDFDQDHDGELDLFNVMHSGYDATHPDPDCNGATQQHRIWSQTKDLDNPFRSDDGISVYVYTLSSALTPNSTLHEKGICSEEMAHVGTVAHEMGHYFGLPDLYDIDGGGRGIGYFGIMGGGHGFDLSGNYPSIMTGWAKEKLHWATPTVIEEPGRYTVESPSRTSSQILKITKGFPAGEYLLLENRQRHSFDSVIPHGGLAIYHVDEDIYDDDLFNRFSNSNEGYPGQAGWPYNGKHYNLALLQADGKYDLEKGRNKGDAGDLFYAEGVNEIGPSKHPVKGPFPNTDSYRNGVVKKTGIIIRNISAIGDKMEFELAFADDDEDSSSSSTIDGSSPFDSMTGIDSFSDEKMMMEQDNNSEIVKTSAFDRMGGLIQDLNGMLYDFDRSP